MEPLNSELYDFLVKSGKQEDIPPTLDDRFYREQGGRVETWEVKPVYRVGKQTQDFTKLG